MPTCHGIQIVRGGTCPWTALDPIPPLREVTKGCPLDITDLRGLCLRESYKHERELCLSLRELGMRELGMRELSMRELGT